MFADSSEKTSASNWEVSFIATLLEYEKSDSVYLFQLSVYVDGPGTTDKSVDWT